jgi:hypothetical protein
MRALSPADCLDLWESGQALHPLDQGLLAIQTAFPETRRVSVADWPLGRRNQALAELRCDTFGRWIRGWSACEQCGDKLEFAVDGDSLKESNGSNSEPEIHFGERVFRLPTSRDLAGIVDERDPSQAAIRLLELCAVPAAVENDAEPPGSAAEWTESEIDAISDHMAPADPLADILLRFDCPSCGHSFEQSLDLASFLWSEIEGRAKRLMLDVHTLASAYGWSETEILRLSDARRDFYLQMVSA